MSWPLGRRRQRLVQVCKYVVDVLDADAQPDHVDDHAAQQSDADNAYCEAQTRGTQTISRMPQNTGGQAGSFSTGWSTVRVVEVMEARKRIHRECMIERGWRWEPE